MNFKHLANTMINAASLQLDPFRDLLLHEELQKFYADSNDKHQLPKTLDLSILFTHSYSHHPNKLILRFDESYQ